MIAGAEKEGDANLPQTRRFESMKRSVVPATLVPFLSLILFVVLSPPSSAQEKSKLIVRPALIPDSLVGKHAIRSFDTTMVRQNWGKLKKGQTAAEVQKLLGLPPSIHVDGINGWTIWWYGRRSVAFNSVTYRLSHWDDILDH
jgi:hypothetical protein